MIQFLLGITVSLILVSIAAIHCYWGMGGKWGANAAVPTSIDEHKVINPTPRQCFLVAFGLLLFAIFILILSEILDFVLPPWILDIGAWLLSFIFILRAVGDFKYIGFFKKIRTTRFAQQDSKYYSPLCLIIGVFILLLKTMADQ